MARAWIRLGDKTSHGGTVIQASAYTYSGGIQVARVGDMVQCPKKGHGTCPIVSGDITLIIDGKPVARHGDKTSCGASLIASQQNSTADQRTSVASAGGEQELSFEDFFTPYDEPVNSIDEYDQHFIVVNQDDEALSNIPYNQSIAGEMIVTGKTDVQGKTSVTTSKAGEVLQGDFAKEFMHDAI